MEGRPPAGDDKIDGVGSSAAEAECVRSDGEGVECTLSLPDDLAGDLDDFCREQYLHREAAVRSLLTEWLDGRSVE